MKKICLIAALFSTVFFGVFAQSDSDPFDRLVEKLFDNFEAEGSSVAVKLFNSDLSNQERKKISKSVQFAIYCTDQVEIVSKTEDADYICSGNIESDGPNYIVSAKLVDNYDGTTIAKARQKVPKNYYAQAEVPQKVETIVVENDVDAEDVLGAVIVGTVIGGVFHALTAPHVHVPAPAPKPHPTPAPRPVPAPRPNRP